MEWALSRFVHWSLRHDVQRAIVARSGVDITLAHAWALGRVVEYGPLRLSELAYQLGIDASTLTPRVRHLVRDGLLRRSEDPRDRRAANIEATDKGRQAFSALRNARLDLLEEGLVNLADGDRAALSRALTTVVGNLDGS